MKKFISALSSFVIAATAMGGAMVYAQTNDSVPATAKTIIDIQSNKSNTVKVESGKSAEIPVDVYVPQSNGIYSITLRLQVNDGEPGKGSYEDKTGKVYSASDSDLDADHKKALEATYGNYGFKIKGDVTENATNWKNQKICFDSGYFTTNKKHAGYYNVGTMSNFIPDTWTISYIGKKAVDNKSNMDSYAAFAATNDVDSFQKTDYANYKPVTKWTKDESWAYDAALISFTVEVPAGLADGDYVIDVVKEPTYNPGPSALFDDNNNLKDKDKWTFIQSSIVGTDSGEDSVERSYESIPLTVKVGEGSSEETKAPAEETKAPAEETKAPAEETKAPAQQTEVLGEVVGDKDIVYDFVKKGDTASVAENMSGNNVCTVDKGETFSVEWRVKHDPGTAGLQAQFDLSDLLDKGFTYVSASADDAPYMVEPEINDSEAATKGIIKYAFGQSEQESPVTDDALLVITLKAPDKDTSATISNNGKLKAVPKEQGKEYSTVSHGLVIKVGTQAVETTAAPAETTAAPAEETKAPAETTAAPTPQGDKLLGDVNCDGSVMINDVVLLNRHLAGTKIVTGQGYTNADANVDGKVSSDDATEIKEYLAHLNLATTKVNTAG